MKLFVEGRPPALNPHAAPVRHGVARVRRQVDQNLLDGACVGADQSDLGIGIDFERDRLGKQAAQDRRLVFDGAPQV